MMGLSRDTVHRLAESIETPLPPIEFARLLITVEQLVGIAHEEGYLEGLIAPGSGCTGRGEAEPEPDLPGLIQPCTPECAVLAATAELSPISPPPEPSEPVKKTGMAPKAPAPGPAPPRKGEPWTPDECRKALALKAGGVGPSNIARQLGRPIEGTLIDQPGALRIKVGQFFHQGRARPG